MSHSIIELGTETWFVPGTGDGGGVGDEGVGGEHVRSTSRLVNLAMKRRLKVNTDTKKLPVAAVAVVAMVTSRRTKGIRKQ